MQNACIVILCAVSIVGQGCATYSPPEELKSSLLARVQCIQRGVSISQVDGKRTRPVFRRPRPEKARKKQNFMKGRFSLHRANTLWK